MAHSRYLGPFLAIIALMTGPLLVQSLMIEYCASMNTAATATNSSIWQSNGLCHDFCVDQSYAFAILQAHDCWCSNYVPAESSQVDSDECDDVCPGWKYDTCGADGLYGYIALDTSPSGTADASSSTSTEQSSTTVETSSPTTSTVHSTTSTSTTTSSTLPDTSSGTTRTTTSPTPSTSVKTVTAGGTVSLETVTVTPTAAVGSGADSGANTSSQSGLSSGATAGIAIGVVAIAAILVGIGAFIYIHRKKRQHEEQLASRPHSNLSGSQGVMSTPTTTMASVWDGENMSTGRRSSRLMPHDPRMDPFATNIYTRFENKSRESINTLQDNQDYSRKVLRPTNPDPPNE
ncbi:hypothetical protein GGR58DRAFT_516519 [Xylaria digitata]|nr:hypothetical protein GGR58DRAFT_516519 [Xylaria digitata]